MIFLGGGWHAPRNYDMDYKRKSERVIQRKGLRRIAINTVGAMEEVELN